MRAALEEAGGAHPDYVNVHAPSTLPGDSEEARAMTEVFGERMPPFSSTKRFTGHPLGACGVHEAVYALLMMRDGFMAGMGDIETPDPCISGLPVVTATRAAHVGRAMSVSFGFGGSCASLVFDAWDPSGCRGADRVSHQAGTSDTLIAATLTSVSRRLPGFG